MAAKQPLADHAAVALAFDYQKNSSFDPFIRRPAASRASASIPEE
jgi:hypothetical protein